MMVNAHLAVIDRSAPEFPVHVAAFPIDNGVLWRYFKTDDKAVVAGLKQAARVFFGIDPKAKISLHVYADFVVDPLSGAVIEGDDNFGYADFLKAVEASRKALIKKGGAA